MANVTLRRTIRHLQNQLFETIQKPGKLYPIFFYTTEAEKASALSTSTNLDSFTVNYLTNSCGLPLKSAILASKKLQLVEAKSSNHHSVLSLLRSFEFSSEQIAKLVSRFPTLLQCKVHSNLHPKLQYLVDNGFVGQLLPELIMENPFILARSLTRQIKPSIVLLKTYLNSGKECVASVKRASWLLTFNLEKTMKPNIEFLLKEGVPNSGIVKLMTKQPRSLMQRVDRLMNAVETVRISGLEPSAPVFVEAVRVMLSMSESTWKRKMGTFKSLGWSEDEVMSALRRDPITLACSEKKLTHMMDFYVNTMKLNPAVVTAYPKLLLYSFDRRVRPRYDVITVLKSNKLLEKTKSPAWIITKSEKQFLKFLEKYLDKVPDLLDLYRGTITSPSFNA